jgi:nucleoside phosphorylase
MEKEVLNLIGTLNSHKKKLASWSTGNFLNCRQPKVLLVDDNFYGSEEYKKKVRAIFESRFGKAGRKIRPDFYAGPIASDGNLIKDTSIIKKWTEVARDFVAIDMELPGVYIAANRRGKHYPVLAIRGISDVVGFERDPAWTQYACETAASFFTQLLRLHPGLSPQSQFFSHL